MDNSIKDIKTSNTSTEPLYQFADYAVRKAEKISSAVYIISNFISSEDPLKVSLRKNVLELISDMYHVKNKQRLHEDVYHFVFKAINQTIPEIVSLLTISLTSGFITQMNQSVLITELETLKTSLIERFNTNEITNVTQQDLHVHLLQSEPYNTPKNTLTKAPTGNKGRALKGTKKIESTSSRVAEKRNRRRAIIMKLLKEKGTLAVRDVAHELPQYSEKTLQRELIKMTNEGVVSRSGERRWTRYTLV